MSTYEELLYEANSENIDVIDYSFTSRKIKGLYCNGTIAIRKNIETTVEKACVLAEEIGHYHTASGDIIDQSDIINRKSELKGRMWAYNHQIGLSGIIAAYKHGCRTVHDTAEHLNVTEDFLLEALERYRSKYGICTKMDNYVIYFEPALGVFELI